MEEVGSEGWKLEYTKLEVFALQYLCFVILEEELVVSTRKKLEEWLNQNFQNSWS